MLRPPPVATRPDPPFPYTTPFRSSIPGRRLHRRRQGVNLRATRDVAQFGRCGKSMEFRSLNRRLRLLPAAMLLAAILAPADAAAARLSTPDCDADGLPVAVAVHAVPSPDGQHGRAAGREGWGPVV